MARRINDRQAAAVLAVMGVVVVAGLAGFIRARAGGAPGAPPSSGPSPSVAANAGPPVVRLRAVIKNPDVRLPLQVEIIDPSGKLVSAELPTDAEFQLAYGKTFGLPGPESQAVANPPNDPRTLIIAWGGGACDRTATLAIAADLRHLVYAQGPRESCDAVGIGWGIRLSFTEPVPAEEVRLDFRRFCFDHTVCPLAPPDGG